MLKSTADRYGAIAVTIHWITAILILALLGSGFQAANAVDPVAKGAFLRVHIPLAVAILLLTLFRIVWWWLFDMAGVAGTGGPRRLLHRHPRHGRQRHRHDDPHRCRPRHLRWFEHATGLQRFSAPGAAWARCISPCRLAGGAYRGGSLPPFHPSRWFAPTHVVWSLTGPVSEIPGIRKQMLLWNYKVSTMT